MLFKDEAPVLSRSAAVESDVPNQSGGTSRSTKSNLIPLEHNINVQLTASSASQQIFVADDYYQLVAVKEAHGTASTSGTLQVEHLTGTQASGAGTSMLTGTMSLSGTANTVISGTLVSTLSTLQLAPGDRLGLVIAGTMTNLANCAVSLFLKRWQ